MHNPTKKWSLAAELFNGHTWWHALAVAPLGCYASSPYGLMWPNYWNFKRVGLNKCCAEHDEQSRNLIHRLPGMQYASSQHVCISHKTGLLLQKYLLHQIGLLRINIWICFSCNSSSYITSAANDGWISALSGRTIHSADLNSTYVQLCWPYRRHILQDRISFTNFECSHSTCPLLVMGTSPKVPMFGCELIRPGLSLHIFHRRIYSN